MAEDRDRRMSRRRDARRTLAPSQLRIRQLRRPFLHPRQPACPFGHLDADRRMGVHIDGRGELASRHLAFARPRLFAVRPRTGLPSCHQSSPPHRKLPGPLLLPGARHAVSLEERVRRVRLRPPPAPCGVGGVDRGALDFSLFGPEPSYHHATNLLLHIVSSLVLFFSLERATRSLWKKRTRELTMW